MALQLDFERRHAGRFAWLLITINLSFIALCAASILLGRPAPAVEGWFNVKREANIPTWFSSAQLFMIAAAFALTGLYGNLSSGPRRRLFAVLAAGFAFLSVDQTAMIHESLSALLAQAAWLPRFRSERSIWVMLYAGVGAAALMAVPREIVTLWRRFPREAAIMTAGAVCMVVGVVGLEHFGIEGIPLGGGELFSRADTAIEEILESSGTTVVLYGAMRLALDLLSAPAATSPTAPETMAAGADVTR